MWRDEELEDMIDRLQLLPALEELTVELSDPDMSLSEQRLSEVALPSLQILWLRCLHFDPQMALDLSWLDLDRSFDVRFALHDDNSNDQLLGFSYNMRWVLQPSDSLFLENCTALCESAQQILSELELWQLCICIDDLSSLVQLPAAQLVRLAPNLRDPDFSDSDGTPTYSTCLSWAAIKSAGQECEVVLDFDQLEDITPSNCFTELHVTDAPMGAAAWQQSLAELDWDWMCQCSSWKSVTGTSSAMRRTSETSFELKAQAA